MIHEFPGISLHKSIINKMNENISSEFIEFVNKFVFQHLTSLEQQKKIAPVQERGPTITLTREIRCMMRSFGDSKKPSWQSVLYVEKILRQQMNLLLSRAAETVNQEQTISHIDLLFLLRKNKVKLKRLLLYLSVKDTKEMIAKLNSARLPELMQRPETGKRVKRCLNFLNKIDNTFWYKGIMEEDIADPLMKKRNERKYALVAKMSDDEYLQYFKGLQSTSFPTAEDEKFLSWLMEDSVIPMEPTKFALDIINYLARETIAEIIDLVFEIREEKELSGNSSDPIAESSVSEKIAEANNDSECVRESLEEEEDKTTENVEDHAITVAEIHEVIQRFAKIPKQNFRQNMYSDVQFPDILLCC